MLPWDVRCCMAIPGYDIDDLPENALEATDDEDEAEPEDEE